MINLIKKMFDNNEEFLSLTEENLNEMKILLENGADINSQDENGFSALIMATNKNNLDMVKFLLENGANINLQDQFGWSALIYATLSDNLEIDLSTLKHT